MNIRDFKTKSTELSCFAVKLTEPSADIRRRSIASLTLMTKQLKRQTPGLPRSYEEKIFAVLMFFPILN